jgi:hypothetical protein
MNSSLVAQVGKVVVVVVVSGMMRAVAWVSVNFVVVKYSLDLVVGGGVQVMDG